MGREPVVAPVLCRAGWPGPTRESFQTGWDSTHAPTAYGVCTFLALRTEIQRNRAARRSADGMEDPRRLRLPDDVLADVLARLAPRSLAVSRCVCREWRAVVDDRCRQLLRPDLLPLTVGGIFVESYETDAPASSRGHRRQARELRADASLRLRRLLHIRDRGLLQRAPPARGTRGRRGEPGDETVGALACDGLPEGHEGAGLYWSYLAFDPSSNADENEKRLEGLQWPPPVYVMRA